MNNDRLFDLLSVLSIILQLEVYQEQKIQANNDDIMQELQIQDEKFFKQIIKNQQIIIEQLNKLTCEG